MANRKEQKKTWQVRGCADTLDGNNSPPGVMASLSNLIPDPSTPGVYVCRPANTVDIDFSTWGAAPGTVGVIVVAYQTSNIVYGMVSITSGAYAGTDYPFAYNRTTATFLAVSGITVPKCPVSQATSGDWTPPQMTATGVDLPVTHIGFPGGAGAYIGWFDITTPTTPVWNAGNTGGNPLPSVPQACQQFNNRTYFFCGSLAYYTDTLAINMTNSNQSLSIDDYLPVTCAAPLPVSTTSNAILQGIVTFKASKIYLLTGDVTTSNLGANEISDSVGTAAPRSAVLTPEGLKFMANDGIRTISFWGSLGEPDENLATPFIYALSPSRACAVYNSDTYRICVQNGQLNTSPYQDWWYNCKYKAWTGPHSFRYDCAVAVSNDFILCSNAIPGKTWYSYSVQGHQGVGVTFTENGVSLSFGYQTPPMDDLGNIYANACTRSTIEVAVPAEGQTYNFTAQNESGTVLATAALTQPVAEAVWGAFLWGAANWGASQSGLAPVTIPWNQAVVMNRLSVLITGPSALGFKIGTLHLGYEQLNYLLN